MIVATCDHSSRRRNGTTATGTVRYRCKTCGKSWTESTQALGGMRIGLDRAVQIVSMLCEGVSVSATARLTETDPHTVIDLLSLVGERCEAYMAEQIRGVQVDQVQCDEIWQYIYCKAGACPPFS